MKLGLRVVCIVCVCVCVVFALRFAFLCYCCIYVNTLFCTDGRWATFRLGLPTRQLGVSTCKKI